MHYVDPYMRFRGADSGCRERQRQARQVIAIGTTMTLRICALTCLQSYPQPTPFVPMIIFRPLITFHAPLRRSSVRMLRFAVAIFLELAPQSSQFVLDSSWFKLFWYVDVCVGVELLVTTKVNSSLLFSGPACVVSSSYLTRPAKMPRRMRV